MLGKRKGSPGKVPDYIPDVNHQLRLRIVGMAKSWSEASISPHFPHKRGVFISYRLFLFPSKTIPLSRLTDSRARASLSRRRWRPVAEADLNRAALELTDASTESRGEG